MANTFTTSNSDGAVGISPVIAWAGRAYAWSGAAIMWLFWISFVIFLAQPGRLLAVWPLPTVDHGGAIEGASAAALVDVTLIALFGLQHSLMDRPWFKTWAAPLPAPFERCTFVHMANLALFALILFWQPIPVVLWSVPRGVFHDALWLGFCLGWLILLFGAWSFGILKLLGVEQMRMWIAGMPPASPRLQTGALYKWLRHPMYVGVLMAVWFTPRMTAGHLLLAAGLTIYVLIGMRYEERDLYRQFGQRYERWRGYSAMRSLSSSSELSAEPPSGRASR